MKTLTDVIRYAGLSVCTYCVLLASIFILVSGFNQNPNVAYALSYALAYILSYMVLTRYVFETPASSLNLAKFLTQTCVFFVLNNIGYYVLVQMANAHYLVAAVAVIGLLFPLRFASAKWLVFAQ